MLWLCESGRRGPSQRTCKSSPIEVMRKLTAMVKDAQNVDGTLGRSVENREGKVGEDETAHAAKLALTRRPWAPKMGAVRKSGQRGFEGGGETRRYVR